MKHPLSGSCAALCFMIQSLIVSGQAIAECVGDTTFDPPPVEYYLFDHILALDSASVDYLSALVQHDFDEKAPVVELTGTLNEKAATAWAKMTRGRLGDRLIYILGNEMIAEDFVHDFGSIEGFHFPTLAGRLSLDEANALVARTLGKDTDEGLPFNVAIIGDGLRLERGTVASLDKCKNLGEPALCIQLKASGAKQMWRLTEGNAGKVLALFWGDRLLTMPVIREPILGGQGIIPFSGDEQTTDEEIDQLICDIMRRWD